ncbi:DUF2607 family protein [Vibrio nereis]|uniref:DUF2607 family protein n=1 Tax=Vibrio nereis TaxID=693 RepID=UPI002494BC9E|nr:DUF2607 family protein [Vibrio nereis]
MSQLRLHSYRLAVIALCSVMLTLWMSVATIEHQYDLSHHQNHHCQLFSCAQHGVSSATLSTEDLSLPDTFFISEHYHYVTLTALVYHARSPPNNPNA